MHKFYLLPVALIVLFSFTAGAQELTFLYYADCREDIVSNWFQDLHEKFVFKVLENEKANNIEHLIFGGDSVLLGFVNSSWERFFEITGHFRKQGIKIYPALGNHEVILSRPIYTHTCRHFPQDVFTDPSLASHEAFVMALEKEYNYPEPTELYLKLRKGFSEAHQESFELLLAEKPGVSSTSWERFKKYVDRWPYLQPMVTQGKTYYSFLLPIADSGLAAKIIVLDSNVGDPEQGEWLPKEMAYTNGPVIFICHHPIFYPEENWDRVPHLWLTGHHHDYERRSLTPPGNTPPIHIISGSGGAPLRWGTPYCNDDKTHIHKNWYNYLRVTVSARNIHLIVFGCEEISQPFQKLDELEFTWMTE